MFGCMISFGYYLALVVGGLLLGNAELYVAWAVSSPLYPSPVLIRFASAATCVPFVARLCTCHAATVHRYWEFLGPSLLVVTGMLAVLIIVKDEPAGAGTWRSIGCLPSTCVTHDGMQGIVSRLSTSQKRKRSERRRGHSGSVWSCQTNASKWGRWPCCELHSRRLCLVPCAHGLLMLQCGRMDSWLVLGLAGELPGRKRWHAARIPSVYRYHQCCVHLWHPGQYGWCVIVLCQMRGRAEWKHGAVRIRGNSPALLSRWGCVRPVLRVKAIARVLGILPVSGVFAVCRLHHYASLGMPPPHSM